MVIKQDICMETTHGRRGKTKTSFKGVLNKVLVSGLILATVAGMGSTTAFASEIPTGSLRDNGYNTTRSQESLSVSSAVSALRNTINTIQQMKANGTVSSEKLNQLASQLYQLEKSVNSNGGAVTDDVKTIISDAEKAISGLSNASQAEVAVSIVKGSLGISDTVSVTATNKADANVSVTSFSDVPSTHWAYSAITNMTSKGLFSGTTTPVNGIGTFSPDKTMSRAEFVVVVVRALYKSELDAAPKSQGQWWDNARQVAIANGLLNDGDLDNGNLSKPMTRQEMAMVLARAAEANKDYPTQVLDSSRIPDYSSVGGYYKDYVITSYSMGMLCGTDKSGTFNPQGTLSRAQAATVLYRLVEPSARQDVDFEVAPPVETGILNQNDPNRRTALAGDTFIRADGTKVVLVLDEKSQVLGYGQGVATDLGRLVDNGSLVIKNGSQIGSKECDTPYYMNNSGNASYRGQTYQVNPFNGSGFWSGDWSNINNVYQPSYKDKGDFDGQLDSTKNFYWDDLGESWNLVVNAPEFVQSVNPSGKQ